MKTLIIFLTFLYAGLATACNSTGTDKKESMPVDVYASDIEHRADSSANKDSAADTDSTANGDNDTKKVITIAMTGDIMMGTTYPSPALPADDGKALFKDVKQILTDADIAVGNLEGTLCDGGETTKRKSAFSYSFRTPVKYAPRLKEAGYDFLSMANNHAFDFGQTGVESTEKALDELGIEYAGIKGRRRAAIIERDGVKYGFCAFGHNSYTLLHKDLSVVKEILDSLCENSDIVIVSFHGGAEGKSKSHLPYGKELFLGEDRGSLREFAHFCVDNGADIVYGHGPHVVRCVEMYKDRFIAYSLGNFCTPYGISTSGISGYAPVVEIDVDAEGSFLSGKIHSFIQKRGIGPRIDTTNSVAQQMKALTAADIKDNNITIADDGKIERKQ